MKNRGRIRFTVEGSGAFPFDMLRYDHCWPEKEATDSYQMSLTRDDGDEYFKLRQITLVTDQGLAPTERRWKSFSWRVVPGSTERVV